MPAHDPDCLFCKILDGELPAQIVDEDERTVAFMDINPATRGHALVVPRCARGGPLLDPTPRTSPPTAVAAQRLALLARDRLGADGVNLLNACAPGGLADASSTTTCT